VLENKLQKLEQTYTISNQRIKIANVYFN